MTIQMEDTDQNVCVVLLISRFMRVITSESVDEMWDVPFA